LRKGKKEKEKDYTKLWHSETK